MPSGAKSLELERDLSQSLFQFPQSVMVENGGLQMEVSSMATLLSTLLYEVVYSSHSMERGRISLAARDILKVEVCT